MPTSPIQSLLVHVDGSARSATRLRLASELAQVHEAALRAVFAVSPSLMPLPIEAGLPRVPLTEEIDALHRQRAQWYLDSVLGEEAAARSWEEVVDGLPVAGLVERALLTDLLVLGQHDPEDSDAADVPAGLVADVVIGSGRPALVVPYAGKPVAEPETVLVAWKPTREAARAVTAALPFLQRAKNVHVFHADEGSPDPGWPVKQLRHFLGLHHVAASGRDHGASAADAGEALLSLAADLGADLLVMGCYGRGRAMERLLGGATRTVLHSMTLPVLMAH